MRGPHRGVYTNAHSYMRVFLYAMPTYIRAIIDAYSYMCSVIDAYSYMCSLIDVDLHMCSVIDAY